VLRVQVTLPLRPKSKELVTAGIRRLVAIPQECSTSGAHRGEGMELAEAIVTAKTKANDETALVLRSIDRTGMRSVAFS
jgi:hypothetical protein